MQHTAKPRRFDAQRLEHYVLRPLFIFITFLLLLFAIMQACGRLVLSVVHVFEPNINAVLQLRDISIQGIRGEWRGINPVLKIGRVEFPQGYAQQVEVELDSWESLLRSHVVARRALAADVGLYLRQSETGWRLRGASGQSLELDLRPTLEHSDYIQMAFSLFLLGREGDQQQVTAYLDGINESGQHYNRLMMSSSAAPDQALQLQAWRQEGIYGAREGANTVVGSGRMVVPSVLSGMPGLTLEAADLRWRDVQGAGGGVLHLRGDQVLLPGVDSALQLDLRVDLQRDGEQVRGQSVLQVAALSATGGEAPLEYLELPRVHLALRLPEASSTDLDPSVLLALQEEPPPQLRLWADTLDLGTVSGFVQTYLSDWQPVGRWISELGAQGAARNIHVFYDPQLGFGYGASMTDVALRGYRGVPTLGGAQGQLWGYTQGIAMRVNSAQTFLQFPELYREGWQLDSASGVIKGWFGDGYVGLRGSHLRAQLGALNVSGGFAVTRPEPRYEQRLTLTINANEFDFELGRTFIPQKIPDTLAQWLETAPKSGTLSDARFAYHGQVHLRPEELGRRIEVRADVSGGRMQYDPGWPEALGLSGSVHVAGRTTRVEVEAARSRDVIIGPGEVVVHDNGRYLSARISAVADTAAALDFVRNSPLIQDLGFIGPGWDGSGNLNLLADLTIPISTDNAPELAVDLQFDTRGLDLSMPNYRLAFEALQGAGTFALPHHLRGEFNARLFGQPARIATSSDDAWLNFAVSGTATPRDVYALIDYEASLPLRGAFDFDGRLSVAMQGDVTNLAVTSDLQGLEVGLPAQYRKQAAAVTPSEVDVQFLADFYSVSWRHKDLQGWLHFSDQIDRGAVGMNAAPPVTDQQEQAIVIAGQMPELVLSDWVSGEGESAVALPMDWVIRDLSVDHFVIEELSFDDLVLNGWQRGEDVQFQFAAPDLQGVVELPGAQMMNIRLAYLGLPAAGDAADEALPVDPISVSAGQSLPAASVVIEQLQLGAEPFGSWRFVIHPQDTLVRFSEFGADVNGVHIEDADISWDLLQNRSQFAGRITLDDLAETLPKWDYAPSLTTRTASAMADVGWPGSPANVALLATTGDVQFRASDGRFSDVESGGGGMRILGLLNFSKVANRINFDFSDVVGEGLSFEKIEANVGLNNGELVFAERMLVDSSSGNFQVGGRVDLHSGTLDNEMIVTLPVSKSLPWYAVYLSLANPLAGLGVVVGERVLRKPLEQFSTAKFEVTGTLDDPQVNFVSLWDRSMKETEAAGTAVQKPAVDKAGD